MKYNFYVAAIVVCLMVSTSSAFASSNNNNGIIDETVKITPKNIILENNNNSVQKTNQVLKFDIKDKKSFSKFIASEDTKDIIHFLLLCSSGNYIHNWEHLFMANHPINVALRTLLTEDNYNFSDFKCSTLFTEEQDPRFDIWTKHKPQLLSKSLRELMQVFIEKLEVFSKALNQKETSDKSLEKMLATYKKYLPNYKYDFKGLLETNEFAQKLKKKMNVNTNVLIKKVKTGRL